MSVILSTVKNLELDPSLITQDDRGGVQDDRDV